MHKLSLRSFILVLLIGSVSAEDYPVVFAPGKRVVLAAQVQGNLKAFLKKNGSHVKKDAVLVEIAHKELLLHKERLVKTIHFLTEKSKNLKKLAKRGLSTSEEMEKIKLDLAIQNIDLQIVEDKIEKSRIKAPFDGKIVKVITRSHEWVSVGQAVVEMISDELQASIDLPARVMKQLKTGQKGMVVISDLDLKIEIELKSFSPEVDIKSNTIHTVWKMDSSNANLLPGVRGVLKL